MENKILDNRENDENKGDVVFLQDYFNEEDYLRLNPDVAKAIENHTFASGKEHYNRYGKYEGRPVVIHKQPVPAHMMKADNMVDVPVEFKQVQKVIYPEGNTMPFEVYFNKCYLEQKPK